MKVTQQPCFFSEKPTVKTQMTCLMQHEEDTNNARDIRSKH